jgi:hypothetical protein
LCYTPSAGDRALPKIPGNEVPGTKAHRWLLRRQCTQA